jgi:hypothetical protein
MVGVLLAMAALLQAPNLVRLDCRIPDARGRDAQLPLAITLDVRGDSIASVIVAGPRLFSSYRRTPPANRPVRPEELRLLPRNMQWRASFQGRAIRLHREGGGITLEPARRGGGAYAGFWDYLISVGPPPVQLHGAIDCHPVSGTLTESARS